MVEFIPGLCLFSKERICICAKVISFLRGGFLFFAGRPLLSPDYCQVLLFSLWIWCSHVMFYKEWTGLVVWTTVAARDECSDESGFTRKLLDCQCNILEWLVTHVVSKQQVWMINQGVHIYWVQNFTHKTHDQCSCASEKVMCLFVIYVSNISEIKYITDASRKAGLLWPKNV